MVITEWGIAGNVSRSAHCGLPRRRAQYRLQAVLVFILFLGIIGAVLHFDYAMAAKYMPSALKNRMVDGDFDSISPFAKKKVSFASETSNV